MTTTVHQQLLARVESALQSLATVPASRVEVERLAPVDGADCPAITILPDGARFESFGAEAPFGGDTLQADLGVVLRIHTRGSPHTELADPIMAEAHAALMADPSLGGIAMRLTLADSRSQAARSDDGAAGVWELTYRAIVLVHESTLGPLGA